MEEKNFSRAWRLKNWRRSGKSILCFVLVLGLVDSLIVVNLKICLKERLQSGKESMEWKEFTMIMDRDFETFWLLLIKKRVCRVSSWWMNTISLSLMC